MRKELNTEYATTDVVQAILAIREGPRMQWEGPRMICDGKAFDTTYAIQSVEQPIVALWTRPYALVSDDSVAIFAPVFLRAKWARSLYLGCSNFGGV